MIKQTKTKNSNKQQSNLTELVFILDRSGSMSGLEKDTIGGFNSLIKKQRKENANAIVSTILFDDEISIIYERMNIKNVPDMTDKEYYPRGCTALLDAIGKGINKTIQHQKQDRKTERPNKTLIVITTDGHENASKEYSLKSIKSLILKQKRKDWNFIFLGANINAIEEASKIGIDADYAATYRNDKKGTHALFCSIGSAVSECCCRETNELPKDWKKKIEEDYLERKE